MWDDPGVNETPERGRTPAYERPDFEPIPERSAPVSPGWVTRANNSAEARVARLTGPLNELASRHPILVSCVAAAVVGCALGAAFAFEVARPL